MRTLGTWTPAAWTLCGGVERSAGGRDRCPNRPARRGRPPSARATIVRVTLLFVLLALAVLGIVAAVGAGGIRGGLNAPASSLPSRGLPPGEVSAAVLESVRFSPALRGYRMEEVDAVLDRLADELTRREALIAQLRDELRLSQSGPWDR